MKRVLQSGRNVALLLYLAVGGALPLHGAGTTEAEPQCAGWVHDDGWCVACWTSACYIFVCTVGPENQIGHGCADSEPRVPGRQA